MIMRRVAVSLVPSWMESLLTAHFFGTCSLHAEAPRSETNLFCLDCGGASSFCFYCRSDRHSGHRVIQIRRSSYHDVVRVAEIQKLVDIGGVQTYVINSARVLFLNERPQPQPRGGGRSGASAGTGATSSSSAHICEICGRALLDSFRFCSLGCKLEGVKRNGDATFILNPGEEDTIGGVMSSSAATVAEEGVRKGGRSGRCRPGSREAAGHVAATNPPAAPNSRKRKGNPHRSPFAS